MLHTRKDAAPRRFGKKRNSTTLENWSPPWVLILIPRNPQFVLFQAEEMSITVGNDMKVSIGYHLQRLGKLGPVRK